MSPQDLYIIIGSTTGLILFVGLALVALIMRATLRADSDRAEAVADRRAFHARMDEFHREMRRLVKRPSRVG